MIGLGLDEHPPQNSKTFERLLKVSDDRFKNYLVDLGLIVKGKAMEAAATKKKSGEAYNLGYLMAWHEIISLMQSQAAQFKIDLALIGVEEINPERDLL